MIELAYEYICKNIIRYIIVILYRYYIIDRRMNNSLELQYSFGLSVIFLWQGRRKEIYEL